ncbi:sensor histidine kinase [Arthrobacter sp. I2-34]|uniref:Oxygen sensor histidine kinase NreB n=1 Tax=Arthrobacter hankyongi TaxID=2904801 RepID=A0ABS9L5P7_9MICC|nr:sensor histidine kinase [Arthrobacter hankyongi]MCG2621802.1 sensor histidine kinase [Arthrobacter hankyongi]
MSVLSESTPPTGALVLRVLRVGLHVGFAGLLALATGATLAARPADRATYLALGLALLLAAVYLAGTVAEKRRSTGGRGPDLRRYAPWWLAAVTVLWVALAVLSASFAWLAFPLFFLHLHVLRTGHAVFAVAALTGVVIASQWWHAGRLEPAMLIGPVVGAVFAVLMGMAYRALYLDAENQRRALAELRRTRAELAQSQHEAGMLAERSRLAREIHDTLAQGLSSIVLVSRSAAAALDAGQAPTAAERIRLVEQTAADNLAEARRFVRGLASVQPAGPGRDPAADGALAAELRRLCETAQARAGAMGQELRCRFNLDGEPVQLPPRYEAALLRAAQASLANVAAHAKAGTAVVSLGFLAEDVTLDIYDDGAGFDPSAAGLRADGTGFGLVALRDRVAALGGSLAVESAPGEGTVVAIRLPLAGTSGPAPVAGNAGGRQA